VEAVANWLHVLGLGEYADDFRLNHIDGRALALLGRCVRFIYIHISIYLPVYFAILHRSISICIGICRCINVYTYVVYAYVYKCIYLCISISSYGLESTPTTFGSII